jgi:hypothetical protein
MERLKYLGERYNSVCQLCLKSWVRKRNVYEIKFPHPAIQSLTANVSSKEICNKCAKREEPTLFKKIQKEI